MDYKKYLEEFKNHCHVVHKDDDENFLKWIEQAHARIKSWCGEFSLDNPSGLLLVKEYVRYLRDGQAEFFYEGYSEDIASLSWEIYEVNDAKTK